MNEGRESQQQIEFFQWPRTEEQLEEKSAKDIRGRVFQIFGF